MITGSRIWLRLQDKPDHRKWKILLKEWKPTPWAVSIFTGNHDSDRYNDIIEWCNNKHGKESYPLRGICGVWKMGSITAYGYTWMGFATKAQMDEFCKEWEKNDVKKT